VIGQELTKAASRTPCCNGGNFAPAMADARLHASLRVGTNLVLAGLWLVGLVGLVVVQREVPWTLISLGLASGVIQGVLQGRAIRDETARFRAARTALEVREALRSTASGRAQIKILWASLAIYLVVALVRSAPTLSSTELGVFSAMLAQWFARESLTVSACRHLERSGGAA
jgi:hypothetical protein